MHKYAGLVAPRWETPDPPGVRGTYGPRVRRWAWREHRVRLDPWQAYELDQLLRYDKSGNLLARVALLSTARQNGKSIIVRMLFGWMLDEGRHLKPFAGWSTILAAAHDAKQARIVYDGVRNDIESNPRLKAETRTTRLWGIEAGPILFDVVTSQPGSARGRSSGLIGFDEMLTQRDWDMWEVLSPTQSAQRSPLMLLTSTAGYPDSVVLLRLYERLKRIAAGDEQPDPAFYGAWWESEDRGAGLDWDQIRMANPTLDGGRLSRTAIEAEYRTLPPDSWARERLNHFAELTAAGAFNPGVWAACRTPKPLGEADGPYALGVDIEPGWLRASLVVSAVRPDGRIGVEVYDALTGTDDAPVKAEAVVQKVHDFTEAHTTRVIAYEATSGIASAFARDAIETGLPYDPLKPGAVVAACMDTAEMIMATRLAVDDPLLDAQVPLAARRPVGQDGAWRFGRHASLGPIEAVVAMSFAAHAIAYSERPVQIFL